jgi:tRNA pseudouridine38-40 synthase
MRNVKLIVEYDGTDFRGWQNQPMNRTVQGLLVNILSELDERRVDVHGASRTDAGAHALGQVASFLFYRDMSKNEILRALNGNLLPDVRIREVSFVGPTFHAQFSAKGKTYRYVFYLGPVVSPFLYRYVYHCRFLLDIDQMRAALPLFRGEHDFSCFASKSPEVVSTIRRVTDLELIQHNEMLELRVTGNGFLRAMVRRIAGTLQEVGRGRLALHELEALLQADESVKAGPSLPAKGLTLLEVHY